MSQHQHLAAACDNVQIWKQNGQPLPGWIQPWMIGRVEPNGTFLIRSQLGQQRVHYGDVVVEQGGDVYAWPAAELDERVAELQDRLAAAARPSNMVGPGKSMKTSIPSGRRSNKRRLERVRTYPAVRGTPPSIEWVSTCDLKVDEDYQRSIDNDTSRRLIASIAAHWDWRLCMPLAVSRRDDGRYVIDGQHRLAAAKLRPDIPHIPCCIATYQGAADEAAMFVAANRARKAINRLDDFHAALVAGDEDAIEVNRIVEAAGLRVSRETRSQAWIPGEVAFTSSIATALSKHGDDLVLDALKAMAGVFTGQVMSNGAAVFAGLTRVLAQPPEALDREGLFRALGMFDMKGWGSFVREARGTDMRGKLMRSALLEAYDDTMTHQRAVA